MAIMKCNCTIDIVMLCSSLDNNKTMSEEGRWREMKLFSNYCPL